MLRKFLPFFLLFLTAPAFRALADEGTTAAAIRLPDPAGNLVSPLLPQGQKATVLIFLSADCPLGNTYAPEIARLVSDYQAHAVSFYAVYASETSEEISRHLKDYKLPLTALRDPAQQLAKATGVTLTPEVAVMSPLGVMLYRGRIDDRAVKLGTVRVESTKHDLRLALDAILQGQPVLEKITKAIGCSLPPLPDPAH